jgi:hypothetical protein
MEYVDRRTGVFFPGFRCCGISGLLVCSPHVSRETARWRWGGKANPMGGGSAQQKTESTSPRSSPHRKFRALVEKAHEKAGDRNPKRVTVTG